MRRPALSVLVLTVAARADVLEDAKAAVDQAAGSPPRRQRSFERTMGGLGLAAVDTLGVVPPRRQGLLRSERAAVSHMTALDHALKWINGELVAGGAASAFGLLLVGCSGLLWRFGESTAARAMVLPLQVTGGLIAVLSGVAAFNNVLRIAEFREAYAGGVR